MRKQQEKKDKTCAPFGKSMTTLVGKSFIAIIDKKFAKNSLNSNFFYQENA